MQTGGIRTEEEANEAVTPTAKARLLFPNQGMHSNAEFLASLHPHAIDYLEQAPALTCCFGVKWNTRTDRLYVAMRVGGPIDRGERLRAVMSSVGLAYPLRKLAASAIEPGVSAVIRQLGTIDASSLSQMIPYKPRAQQEWLRGLRDYSARLVLRDVPRWLHFAWVARHAALAGAERGIIADTADFISQNPTAPIEAWGWARLIGEMELWHDRIASENGLRSLPGLIKPDTCIDLSDWPDTAEVDGFEFFKLATPAMIMEEGRRQRHCVGSYIADVLGGKTSLFSIRQDLRRVATLQVVGKRVVQLKGFANKAVSSSVRRAAEHFLSEPA